MSGEKINDELVSHLLTTLRSDTTINAKVNLINQVKSSIKQNNVPDTCILPLFDAARIALTSQQAAIVNAGFTTLVHLLSRLSRQEPKYIVKEAGRTLPMVIEKMGDSKEKYRQLAAQCLTTFWNKAPMEVERIIKNTGLCSKNPRMKDSCICWIVQTHQESAMPFKNYVSTLVGLLEDADGMTRDAARNAVITLFQNASNAAKSDLKKQLKIFNVRPTIASAIITHLGPPNQVEASDSGIIEAPLKPALSSSLLSVSSSRSTTQIPEVKPDYIEPAYVNTQRELEGIFQEMYPCFEGKECEQNWLKREQSCTMLRRLNAGNAPSDYHDPFLIGIKGLLDGILKAVNSLRTSLSKEGCSLVQEIVNTAGTGFDPMVEILLQNMIKLCGGTKKIISQQGNITVNIIVSKVSYTIRIMQHIWAACQDKNVQPRTYATGWLKTLLQKEAHHKAHIEHTGGLDLIVKCIKKGLADANPGVREAMRSTYWKFASIWPAKADGIMSSLEATQQKLLENAPDNPSIPKKDNSSSSRPGLGFSKSSTNPPKPSLKDAMLAQKKAALANKHLPARPGSAMSSFSPGRHNASSNNADVPPSRARLDTSSFSHGGLSIAPMRPNKSRVTVKPDLITRPSTAGPYSVRRRGHTPSHSASSASPLMAAKDKISSLPITTTPRRLPPRPNTSHSSHICPTPQTTPKKNSRLASPRINYHSPELSVETHHSSRLSNSNEDLKLITPVMNALKLTEDSKSLPTLNSNNTEEQAAPHMHENLIENFSPHLEEPPIIVTPVTEQALEIAIIDELKTPKAKLIELSSNQGSSSSCEDVRHVSPLLDSGIKKVLSQDLDVHGFRKIQGIIRESNEQLGKDISDILISGLFDYLEAPLDSLATEKKQDIRAQVLSTIKLIYRKDSDAFCSHVIRGLEAILRARQAYDSRVHIVSGLEILSSELILISEASPTANAIIAQLLEQDMSPGGCRILSMGLHMLKELLNVKTSFTPSEGQLADISLLAGKCLSSSDSGVRMDAVQVFVAIHSKVGNDRFWKVLDGMRDDPKSLITYYIVKQQKDISASAAVTA